MQRRYINPETASLYKRQNQILLAITERLGLLKGDKEAFPFMERYERADYRQRRSVKTILEVRRDKLELHEQWMRVVRNMPQTAEIVNDETEHEYSSTDEEHRRIPTRKQNPSH